jgi:glycosyltransferase involved in cell wall biosynthesis
VVPLGVDTDLFKPRPEEPPLPYPKPIFTYMGRIAPEKGVEEFLSLDLPGTKLVIGRGESKEKLEKEFPDAVFTGIKEREELAKLLAGSDVFVFPSRTETFGLTILEAFACGTPAAAHDCMGPRDIITDGVDGYLSEDLKDAAQKALKLSREKCREKALQYTWQKSVDAFLANLAPITRY